MIIIFNTWCRCKLKEGDKILFTNMPKLKQMPNTKSQGKFLGPFTASRITDSRAIISKEELNSKRDKKVPIHITQLYYERQEIDSRLSNTKSTEKRKVDLTSDSRETKRMKLSQVRMFNISLNAS